MGPSIGSIAELEPRGDLLGQPLAVLFGAAELKLWHACKPTLAAVQGWCIGGGSNRVLCADLVVAGEGAPLRAQDVGFRRAVRVRDDPFGAYGSRPRG